MDDIRPTRTHNVDDPSHGTKMRETLWSANAGETVKMGIANADAIYAMLSDLSAIPGAYVLREAYSNAYDATLRAGSDEPIEIVLPEQSSANGITAKLIGNITALESMRVTDHGCGMTPDEVRNNFLQYGGSDKLDELDSVGSKGLGAKAPLAIADAFDVFSTKDGITSHAHVTRNANAAASATLVVEETHNPDGTTVVVPVGSPDVLSQMWQFADQLSQFATDIPITLNGKLIEAKLPTERAHASGGYICLGEIEVQTDPPTKMRAWQRYSDDFSEYQAWPTHHASNEPFVYVSALIGGVCYPLENHRSTAPYHIFEVDPGWLDFTPSRDEIKDSPSNTAFIEALREAIDAFDPLTLFDEHISCANDRQLLAIRSASEFSDENKKSRSRLYRPFSFERSFDGTPYVSFRRHRQNISEDTWRAVESIEAPIDVIEVCPISSSSTTNSTRASIIINGLKHNKSSRVGDALYGRYDAQVLATALSKPDTTAYVIDHVDTADDLAWLARNENVLRTTDLVNWCDRKMYLLCVPTGLTGDTPTWRSIADLPHIDLETCKDRVREEMAARRAKNKEKRESALAAATPPDWTLASVNYCFIPNTTNDERFFLRMLTDKSSRAEHQTLAKLIDEFGIDSIAIVMLDEDERWQSCAHPLSYALALARKADPTAVPDKLRILAVIPAKTVGARAVNEMVRLGAFVVADKRSKIKGIHQGLTDTRPDLINITSNGAASASVAGITDAALVARVAAFGNNVFAQSVTKKDFGVADILTHLVEDDLLGADQLAIIESVRTLYKDICTYTTTRPYTHQETSNLTLDGEHVPENSMSFSPRAAFTLMNLSKDTRQILKDADTLTIYGMELIEMLELSTRYRHEPLDEKAKQRIKAFAAAFTYDMNDNLKRTLVTA